MEDTMKSFNKSASARLRRERALLHLKQQLGTMAKTNKIGNDKEALNDHDVRRIKKEIEVLMSRL